MHFVDLADVHAFSFVSWDFKTIFHDPFWYFFDTLMDLSFYGRHIFEAIINVICIEWLNIILRERWVVISLILIMNRITNRMLPWDKPISRGLGSENVLFLSVWKVWSFRKGFIKMGSLPHRPRYLSIPYHRLFQGQKRLQPNVPFKKMLLGLGFYVN